MPRQVILLCGPPGSGKTTLARTTGLTVYDRDDPRWPNEATFLNAITLLAHNPDAQAIVIRAGATPTARATAARRIRATETRILLVDPHTCQERIAARKQTTQAIRRQMAGVTQWWATYQPDPPGGVQPRAGKRNLTGDPALKTPERKALRAAIAAQRRGCEMPDCKMPSRAIDYSAPRGDPWSYVLDEITPRWVGGDPVDPDNVRPAHARCNSSAGARIAHMKMRAKKPQQGEQASTASRW